MTKAREELPIDAKAVAERMAGRLTSFAADQGVSIQVTGDEALIRGSETLAEEMLYNLIENGVRYNHEGGSVTVSVSQDSASQQDVATLREAGAEGDINSVVTVRVADTGPGIPVEAREKVFQRFFRLDKSRSKETGGTGLGLAIVKHAVQYHRGVISVEGAPGEGTTFVLKFPGA